MTAELGVTRDPAALVPGTPSELVRQADVLDRRSAALRSVGEALRRIDTGAWTGIAADAWHAAHSTEVPRWFQAADSLSAGADALRAHASVLSWAEQRASAAIATWDHGEALAVRQPADGVSATAPGETERSAARDMIDDARRQVRESAARLAGVLRTEGEAAPQDSLKQSDANFFGGIWDSVSAAGRGAVRAVTDPLGAVGGAVDAVTHPVRTARDLVAWDDWTSGHGDRALGKVTGSAAIGAATFGAGRIASALVRRGAEHRGVAEDGPATPTAVPAAADPMPSAIEYATRGPKMDHVFVPKHKLDPLVEHFGDRRATMVEIVRRLGDGDGLPASGPFEVVREIAGQPVHIRGAVVDGTPKIGTVFTP